MNRETKIEFRKQVRISSEWLENDCERELKERIEHIESFTPSHGSWAEL